MAITKEHFKLRNSMTYLTAPGILTALDEKYITMTIIEHAVCEAFGIEDVKTLNLKSRKREILFPRQICMFLGKELKEVALATKKPYPNLNQLTVQRIGERYGLDHATVIHSHKTVQNIIETDLYSLNKVEQIVEKIGGILCLKLNERLKSYRFFLEKGRSSKTTS